MRSLLFLNLLLLFSATVKANSVLPLSVKDRLRIVLWNEGLAEKKIQQKSKAKAIQLPEELERPLRHF